MTHLQEIVTRALEAVVRTGEDMNMSLTAAFEADSSAGSEAGTAQDSFDRLSLDSDAPGGFAAGVKIHASAAAAAAAGTMPRMASSTSSLEDVEWPEDAVISHEAVYEALARTLERRYDLVCTMHQCAANWQHLCTPGDAFMVVRRVGAHGRVTRPQGEDDPSVVVVDLHFKERHALSYCTPQYRAFHATVESVFVGSYAHLHDRLARVAAAMKCSFHEQRLELPPWRSPQLMRRSYQYSDTSMPKHVVDAGRRVSAGSEAHVQQLHETALRRLTTAAACWNGECLGSIAE